LSESTGESDRRFGGVARLYGDAAADRIRAAHIVVIGIGGVGSWAAEALARCGVGRLTLIDMDHVAESNVNRQVHALGSTLGASKIEVMAARIADISPDIRVDLIDDFVTVDNAQTMVSPSADVVPAHRALEGRKTTGSTLLLP
jgi:tRNA A37 threonylcarbamoyladenosine dehydratase